MSFSAYFSDNFRGHESHYSIFFPSISCATIFALCGCCCAAAAEEDRRYYQQQPVIVQTVQPVAVYQQPYTQCQGPAYPGQYVQGADGRLYQVR
ncbi:hypothetical protein Ae201684_015388 [Aphanomyces euteiches]|uniref:Uncharacterized protein n=1 Tax=Aphanomyces euteiches TaxID=100861 RepID=A0A6G0WGU2_9STRA|nr:hypothetical protein Ae201684_015388 [Aphanomyces euteiches]